MRMFVLKRQRWRKFSHSSQMQNNALIHRWGFKGLNRFQAYTNEYFHNGKVFSVPVIIFHSLPLFCTFIPKWNMLLLGPQKIK